MPHFPHLNTERLALREIVEADARALYAIHGNAAHMQWFGVNPLPDLLAAEKLIEVFASWRLQANPGTRWALELKGSPGLIGTCGLFSWNRGWKKCSIGYELSPAHVGQGFMTEALRAAIAWGFVHMQLNRVEAQVHPQNAASVALLERLGFVREGLLRQLAYWGGSHHDMLQYSLLKSEWGQVT
jgi:ribosomal-protein-alanine N-acetyltransferase